MPNFMRSIAIATVLSSTLITVGCSGDKTKPAEIAQYIPEQSRLFYVASHYPIGKHRELYGKILPSAQTSANQLTQHYVQDIINATKHQTAGVKFLAGLYTQFMMGFYSKGQTALFSNITPDSQLSAAIYLVDTLPVIRVESPQTQADKIFATIESNMNITSQTVKQGDLSYRTYPLMGEGESATKLVATQIDDYFVLTLSHPLLQQQLTTALATKPLKDNIVSSGKFKKLINRYQFKQDYLFYLDQLGLVDDITNPTSTLNQLVFEADNNAKANAETNPIYSESCRTEFKTLMRHFPESVIGMRSETISDNAVKGDLYAYTSITDKQLLTKLQKTLAPLPVFSQDPLLSLGIAINVNELLPTITTTLKDINAANVKCPVLNYAKLMTPLMLKQAEQLSTQFKMVSELTELQSVSMTLFDVGNMNSQNPSIPNIDGVVTFISTKPEIRIPALLLLALPELSELKEDHPIVLSSRPISSLQINVAQRGKYLFVYSGEKSQKAIDMLSTNNKTTPDLVGLQLNMNKQFITKFIAYLADNLTHNRSLFENNKTRKQAIDDIKSLQHIIDNMSKLNFGIGFGIDDKGIFFREQIDSEVK